MIIYTNESNPNTLKLIICANIGEKCIEIKKPNLQDPALKQPKRFPILQLESGKQIFGSNSAAQFLTGDCKINDSCILEWLEWESSVLRPLIVQTFGQSKIDSNLKEKLVTVLQKLDKINTYLVGEKVSVCDISIWSVLYPIYIDQGLRKQILTSKIEDWMDHIEKLPVCKTALSTYTIAGGPVSYQALSNGERYVNQVNPEVISQSSPMHQVDVVTEAEIKFAEESWLNGNKNLPTPKPVVNPVLPKSGEKNILITSALPYVNNIPHLGNIIGCVLSADVFARFCRLCNYNTILICGTDEYGTATETKALEEGLTPQQICDKYFEIHNTIYRWFGIGFDYFGRTTTSEQTELVQDLFLELNKNGFMQTQSVDQLLCPKCDRYLADRFVEGGCPHPGCGYEDARGDQCDNCSKLINATELVKPRCKVCGTAPVQRQSKQFFLDLPKLEPMLYHWFKKTSPNWSNNACVIAKSWLREGLKPRCITRDLKWGIPVPLDGFRNKVFYVWFDAPIGYISITKRYTNQWEKWWKPAKDTEISLYQFMAKDNVPFHTIMFPAVLFGTNRGYTVVNHVMATEYLNYEDGKFSKSRGVGVFGTDALETGIPSDVWRFYLLYVRPENQDSSFSWMDLCTKNNSELLNNLGNFINRTLSFTEKFFNSTVPKIEPTVEDFTFLAFCTKELKNYMSSLEKAKLRDGIRYILAISKHGNQYMQSNQPWVLLKGNDEEKVRAGTVIGICCNIVCLLATLLQPYMPETSRTIQKQLNSPALTLILNPEKPQIVQLLPPELKIGKPVPLFSKIEPEKIEELKSKYAGKQSTDTAAPSQNVADLESAIAKQGDKVRLLKTSGAEKKVWELEVAILLDLKKKLSALTGAPANAPAKKGAGKNAPKPQVKSESAPVTTVSSNDTKIKALEQQIEKQSALVRQLKTGGAPKAEWQPEVVILLDLKNKLANLTGVPIAAPGGKKSKK